LALEKLGAVGAFFADDLGEFGKAFVVDSSAPPSPAMFSVSRNE
jgi:hypothetical protein